MADLRVSFAGLTFPNPVFTAAGPPSQDGAALVRAAQGGAGGLVCKTVSVKPAPVPHPNMMVPGRGRILHLISVGAGGGLARVVRTEVQAGQALLNTELWSELPLERWLAAEYPRARETRLPVIASIGYTADEVREVGPQVERAGVDAIEFSVHYLGGAIDPVLETARALRDAVSIPVFAKLSPNVPDLVAVARAIEPYVDGFVAINSLGPCLDFDPENPAPYLGSPFGYGWISGAPIRPLALRCVFELARATPKPVIGVGGIMSGRDAVQFLMAGARAVQICTGAILQGPGIYGRVAAELGRWLDDHGYGSPEEIRGRYLRAVGEGQPVQLEVRPARVDTGRCTGCGLCLPSCPAGAISQDEVGPVTVDAQKCQGCGLCGSICPQFALSRPY
ncbi:MAG: 4Fe-4S binding protein [Firmicutes bacterium]|nr:4Fe-4S binding protein [Bacillota bacterium]